MVFFELCTYLCGKYSNGGVRNYSFHNEKKVFGFWVSIGEKTFLVTGKSFSEALILASTNPQCDKRLFIELHVQYMKIASSEHGENMLCT